MADRDHRRDDEPLGYKRPPRWGQFRKGQSGNPKGRPRKKDRTVISELPAKLTEFEQLVADLLGEEIMLTLGGSKVPVSKKRAILLNLFKQAMGGQPLAMRELNRFVEKVEAKEEAQARAMASVAEQAAKEKAKRDEVWYQQLCDLKKKQTRVWAQAAVEGREEPDEPWPHPDDILIDHSNRTARVRGPIDASNAPAWEYLRKSRDHHLSRVVYHAYLDGTVHRLISRMWLVGLVETDRDLPKRWQISHNIAPATDRLTAIGMTRLEALVSQGAVVFEAGSSGLHLSGEDYRRANQKWGPLVRMLGFRSLRHMERFGDHSA